MNEIEIQIDFSDVTLSETDGVFSAVDEIMRKEPPFNEKWVLRSNITIMSPSGVGEMVIQCHGTGEIHIMECKPSIRDVYYNNDIQGLSLWAQTNGWLVPCPHYLIVESNKTFWKYFWDTLIVDSDYLDKLYGKRDQIGDDDE